MQQPRGNISAGLFAYINESITKRSVDSKLKFKEAVQTQAYTKAAGIAITKSNNVFPNFFLMASIASCRLLSRSGCSVVKGYKQHLFSGQTPNIAKNQNEIVVIQLAKFINHTLKQRRVFQGFIKKLAGCEIEIFTDPQKFCHGRQGFPGRDIVHVPSAVAEVVAHLIFRNAFFETELGNPFTNKIFIHCCFTTCLHLILDDETRLIVDYFMLLFVY